MCWSHLSRLLPLLFFFFCCWSSAFAQDAITNPVEVSALRAIKDSLNDPVRRLRNWRGGDPCTSNWTGVLCSNSTLDDGYLHVKELQLFSMNLSGSLSPELGRLTRLSILDFMWNKITGSIPKEIGNIKSLQLLLLNGNLLTGNLPEELGFLPNLDRIQIDENRISGPLPKSFANLNKTKHFHMNNNSISGQIPPELGTLPSIVHILLDNNNLSGYLPPELSNMPNLLILQLDNNHFDGTTIPPSYGNMSKLLKMSLRNCSLQGPMPDLSSIPNLGYLDLSRNQLNGSIPTGKLSDNMTTIDLSNNSLTGTIPTTFSGLPRLQKLSVANNDLSGSIPSSIYQDRVLNSTETLIVDLRNNRFSNISGRSDPRPNVTIWLQGNPLCTNENLLQFCGALTEEDKNQGPTNTTTTCSDCPPPYEFSPDTTRRCFCAAPLLVGYRLKSPGFSDFVPYISEFEQYITSGLSLNLYQLRIDSFRWQRGPRLRMYLKFFPVFGSNANNSFIFNRSEVLRIRGMFTGWNIRDEDLFGPYELMNFTLLDVYRDVFPEASASSVSKGALVGIILGSVAAAVTLTAIIALIIMRKRMKGYTAVARKKRSSKASLKIEGSVANNDLSGSIPSSIYQDRVLNSTETLIVDLRNNRFSNISGRSDPRPNVTIWLQGNPLCTNENLLQFCGALTEEDKNQGPTNTTTTCSDCPPPYEFSPDTTRRCFCAAPLLVGYRLKSPGFSDFVPYISEFEQYITSGLSLNLYQLRIDSFRWQKGPRLRMYLKFFPVFGSNANNSFIFNRSEVLRIRGMFTGWNIRDEDLFGPYELMNFTLLDVYRDVFPEASASSVSKGALVGIILGSVAAAVTLTAIIALIIMRKRMKGYTAVARKKRSSKASLKIEGVKSFTYAEMALATDNFNSSTQIGQGGYGKVYKGTLGDGTVVAIKRAQEGSLQGEREFLTEIELLSRLHHRNLVALLGFCDEEGEQMLVYEYMENGTLRDNISVKLQEPLDFAMRMRIALGSAKGILYLHTEANPPIFHRDIKASNILLDSRFIAKVADFGLSRLAPVPDMEGISPHHVSTVVKGTPGYLDPEYFLTHQLTDKSDVYSLGVVFLELLTGMHPITHGKNIVREVNIAYQSGSILSVVDKRMSSVPPECIEKFATLALRCCREETDARPSMAEVVRELEIIWELMPDSHTAKTAYHSETTSQPSSSSSIMKNPNPYTSMDVSGSDLVSGIVPSLAPR